MSYPDIDGDYPDGHTFFAPSGYPAGYDAYVEESLVAWNELYDALVEYSGIDLREDDAEDWWPPQDDHDLLEVG